MQYDPIMAALVKERGPIHPDYKAVMLQEKILALALEGRLDMSQPRPALLRQVREIARREREAKSEGREGRDPAAVISRSLSQSSHARRESVAEHLRRQLHKQRGVLGPGLAAPSRLQAIRLDDPEAIIDDICAIHRIGRKDLLGPCRRHDWAHARFELFYRLRAETKLSYKAIGALVGGRHYSTVLHGVREWRRANGLPDPDIRRTLCHEAR